MWSYDHRGPHGSLSDNPPIARLNEREQTWLGLHPENYPRDKRSGAEQLGHHEQGERETAGRRVSVTVMGLGLGFHLVSVQEVVATVGVTRVA